MRAVKCPVCESKGWVLRRESDPNTKGLLTSKEKCHGCNGKGWVTVPGSEKQSYTKKIEIDTTKGRVL